MNAVLERNRVMVAGTGDKTLVFGHGLACDQNTWQRVTSRFERDFRVVRYDVTGSGRSDHRAYDLERHRSLQGHADDLLEILDALELERVRFVGHSAGGMIGVLAAVSAPARFDKLALVGASPSYIDDGDYTGGYPRAQIDAIVEMVERDYLAWCDFVVPASVGNADRPALAQELLATFRANEAPIAQHFARVILRSDHRAALPALTRPTLVVQTAQDIFVPEVVGRYLARQVAHGDFVQLRATGHYPQLSGPDELFEVLHPWLAR